MIRCWLSSSVVNSLSSVSVDFTFVELTGDAGQPACRPAIDRLKAARGNIGPLIECIEAGRGQQLTVPVNMKCRQRLLPVAHTRWCVPLTVSPGQTRHAK
jgi:hypothetical protein